VTTPTFSKKAFAPIAIAGLFVAIVGATQFLRGPSYYPHVVVEAQDNLKLEFLHQGRPTAADCRTAAAAIADAVRASCAACRIAMQSCMSRLEPEYERLLSEEPVTMPTSRLPNGVVAYSAPNEELALAACRETERLTGASKTYRVTCYPPHTARPLPGKAKPQPLDSWQINFSFLILLLSGLASAFTGHFIVRYEALHAPWSHDRAETGPQKFHTEPTPRIGGFGLMIGLFVSAAVLLATEQGASREQFGYLLLASLPAFLGGITEDVTKNVSALARLALTLVAAALGAWLLGAVIPRLDIPGFDVLLRWAPFAIAFTIFAVGGVANAINIIDGYNGLAGGHAVIVLAAMAYVSAQAGDGLLLIASLAMIGALLGFLAWNYPKGKIFLGDGGAYLLGFWLAELSVLLVVRHPEISPWFPMLLLVYPIFETLFSIYRRKVVQGVSPGQPDRLHMHQVIYVWLTRGRADRSDPASITRLSNTVAPFGWLMTLSCAIPAMVFWGETRWLVAASLFFCAAYISLYRWLLFSSRSGA